MGSDLDDARRLIAAETLTIAVVRDDQRWTSQQRGLAGLLAWQADPAVDLSGASAADLVVGKAAALLYAEAGVKAVWAGLLSETAVPVLVAHGIEFDAAQRTEFIRNRAGDGMCPMEQAAQEIDDPRLAPQLLRQRITQLRAAG